MKLLVIQEQHFVRMPNGEVWVDEQSDSKFWERYLAVFDEVVVCARFKHSDKYNTDKLMLSDHDGVSFVELPNTRGVSALLKAMPMVIKIMKGAMKQCDRIIFRAPSPISMIAYPLAKSSGKPYAAEIMNNPYTHFSPAAMHHWYQPLLRDFIVRQTKSLCKDANGVSYVTDHILQELYPSNARINGETKSYFESSYSTIRMCDERYSYTEWPNEKPQIVTLIHTGKMQDNRKGQDIFIKALAILKNKGHSVNGILVGDGVMRKEFESLGMALNVSECLDFVGWKAGFEEVSKELKKAHFAVFPSMGEGLPRSVIEGMAQGLLCFGSKVDGICELLDNVCLVPEFTPECFAQHIEYYLNNWQLVEDERRKQYGVSLKYRNDILEKKRTEFYTKLYNAI
jgi:glycosyltransferase, family 1